MQISHDFIATKTCPNHQRSKLGDRSKTPHSAQKQNSRDANRVTRGAVLKNVTAHWQLRVI